MNLLTSSEIELYKELDRQLQERLVAAGARLKRRSGWRNAQVKRFAESSAGSLLGLQRLIRAGRAKGLFAIRVERRRWIDSDGERRMFTLARAAGTDMFPMGTHFWVRDNAIIGARLLKLEDKGQQQVGRALLLSCLTFMSSVAQLKRFEAVIRSKSRKFVHDVDSWPQIFAGVTDNLTTASHEKWAHKQEAWQALAWYLLEALEAGQIPHAALTDKHKRFLGVIIPFLAKVSFWKSENSGSWEEIAAIRTSVRAWEHRLIVRLGELAEAPRYAFLKAGYSRMRRYLGARYKAIDLKGAVRLLDREAVRALKQDVPFESPMYSRSDVRFRRRDAALIYLLELDYVAFLGERLGRSAQWVKRTEQRLLSEILALQDDWTGGIVRYEGDSYQRSGFFRFVTTAQLVKMYGASSGDASKAFEARDKIVPSGRQAAWTHFVWQLAAWAGQRFLVTRERDYKKMHTTFFTQGLKLITGDEVTVDVDPKGGSRVISVSSWRMPECYIADKTADGVEIVFPSPHTPLNWAVAEMLNAFRVREEVLKMEDRERFVRTKGSC